MSDYLKYLGAGAITLGALTTATAMYMNRGPHGIKHLVDLNDQSLEIPGKDRAHISHLCKNGKLIEYAYEDAQTLYTSFKRGARMSKNGPCLGTKPSATEPYQWVSYGEVLTKSRYFGAAAIQKGQKPTNNTYIGVYSQNRAEYYYAEQGCYMYSMVLVPLYDTLGQEAVIHIINQAEISLIICDTLKHVSSLLSTAERLPGLRTIVVMEKPTTEHKEKAKPLKMEIIHYEEFEKLGKDNPLDLNPCTPDDTCIVCYTSGTTGLPKGAIITHRGMVSTVAACHFNLDFMDVGPDDCMISYLPLAHSYERLVESYTYMHGGRIGFFQGDIRKLMDDIKELQPTLFPTVPRLLNRIYDKVMLKVNSSRIKKMVFNIALHEKEKEIKRGIVRNNSIWDKLAFKAVQDSLGGRLKLITTGSAPLEPGILMFMRCILGCSVLEGYGQTESSSICTLQIPGEFGIGQVGPPLCCNLMKVVDVPEMDYYAKDDAGEVCIKGPNVFAGYLKDPKKTSEAMDSAGWLHTGDIGRWRSNGTIQIVDRKKNIFKLSQGEYIAPEKIENIYIRSPLIAQIYVHGDSLKSCLVCVAVPDAETFPMIIEQKLGIRAPISELAQNQDVKKAVLADITELGRKSGLSSLELVKDVYIHAELFTVDNGLLTPTMKTKRNDVCKFFKTQIDDMYSRLT